MTVQPIKNAAEHIASLKDGRTVYINGELVADATEHPAFRKSIRTAANLYDYQADPINFEAMTLNQRFPWVSASSFLRKNQIALDILSLGSTNLLLQL